MYEPHGVTAASSAITVSKPLTVRVIHYEIAHHISGRIRLRIPRLAHDARFAQALSEAVMTLHLLEHARVSSRASSLVITYRDGAIIAGENAAAPGAGRSILPQIIECIRVAAGADVAQELMPQPQVAAKNHADVRRADEDGVDYVKRLGLPVLGLALGAAASAALWIPRVLAGGAILASAIPIFRRTLQGVRDEKRLTVEFLDSLTIVLLTLQGSFFAPAFIVGVIEGSEIVRDWTARRKKQATLDLLLSRDRQVLVERNGREMSISWHLIEIDDVIHVYPGDQVPADGVVLEGSGLIDQHRMTGDFVASTPPARRRSTGYHAHGRWSSAHPGHTHGSRDARRHSDGLDAVGARHRYAGQQPCPQGWQLGCRANAGDRHRCAGDVAQRSARHDHRRPRSWHGDARVGTNRDCERANSRCSAWHPDSPWARAGKPVAGQHDCVR